MKYRVNWKLEGSYTVTNEDLDIPDDETSVEAVEEVVNDDPFVDVEPAQDGKLTLTVEESN